MSDVVTLTKAELEDMMHRAAERGASTVLERLGLHDEKAGTDIRDLRGLLDAWRWAKRTAWNTFIRWSVTVLLSVIAASVVVKKGGF